MAKRVVRPIRIENNLAFIALTQGYEAVIDAADVPLVDGFNWRVSVQPHTTYAFRGEHRSEKYVTVYLHRALASPPSGMTVDHIDGDGLNNRRDNLRVATLIENNRNKGRRKINTSGYKGVSWDSRSKGWRARIRAGSSEAKYLGVFDTPEAAYKAYCEAATRLHGEFARLE